MTGSPRALGRLVLIEAVLAAATVLPVPAGAQPSPAYLALARLYARGERAAAVAEIGSWTKNRLSQEIEELRANALARERTAGAVSPEAPLLRAIVMLHTDRDALERRPSASAASVESQVCGPRLHMDLAERVAALLIGDPEGRGFARRWYLAMALRGLSDYCLGDARHFVHDGLKEFPRDAELLLASGIIDEAAASLVPDGPTNLAVFSPRQRDEARGLHEERLIALERARHAFEQALAADGSLLAARLHLGRTRWSLDDRAAARAALEAVIAARPPADLRYLAHLFLGRVHEDEGRLGDAEKQYREALAADPSAQAAAVALSCVLQLRGEPNAARAVLEAALAFVGQRNDDVFWGYLFYRTPQADGIFEALRREAFP